MSDQIGWLTTASPCSIGFAGHGATRVSSAVGALKVNNQSASQSNCAQNLVYPLSRKLYLATVPGFAAVTGNELQLAGCATDLPQSFGTATPAGLVTANLGAYGLFSLPSNVNGGEPYCEDFNENMLCPGTSANVNACAASPGNFPAFPSFNTVCGNGIREALELCDCGTPQTGGAISDAANVAACAGTVNGGPNCSTVCR